MIVLLEYLVQILLYWQSVVFTNIFTDISICVELSYFASFCYFVVAV